MSTKACRECGEEIQEAAKKCRFCGERFDGAAVPPVAPPAPPVAPPVSTAARPAGGVSPGMILVGIAGIGVLGIGALLVMNQRADDRFAEESAGRRVAEDRLAGDAANRLVEDQRLAAEATARRLEEERMAAIAAENARKKAECDSIRAANSGRRALDEGISTLRCMHSTASSIEGSAVGQVDSCTDGQNASGSVDYVMKWDGLMMRYTTSIRTEWKLEAGLQAFRTILVGDNATINAEPGCIRDYWAD